MDREHERFRTIADNHLQVVTSAEYEPPHVRAAAEIFREDLHSIDTDSIDFWNHIFGLCEQAKECLSRISASSICKIRTQVTQTFLDSILCSLSYDDSDFEKIEALKKREKSRLNSLISTANKLSGLLNELESIHDELGYTDSSTQMFRTFDLAEHVLSQSRLGPPDKDLESLAHTGLSIEELETLDPYELSAVESRVGAGDIGSQKFDDFITWKRSLNRQFRVSKFSRLSYAMVELSNLAEAAKQENRFINKPWRYHLKAVWENLIIWCEMYDISIEDIYSPFQAKHWHHLAKLIFIDPSKAGNLTQSQEVLLDWCNDPTAVDLIDKHIHSFFSSLE